MKGPSLPPTIKGPTLPPDLGTGDKKGTSKRDYGQYLGDEEEDDQDDEEPEKKKTIKKVAMEAEEEVSDWVPPEGEPRIGIEIARGRMRLLSVY